MSSFSLTRYAFNPLMVKLQNLGYVEGQNIRLELRSAAGKDERLPEMAAELIRLKVDVIVAEGLPAIHAAKKVTQIIPIVMLAYVDSVKAARALGLTIPQALLIRADKVIE